MKPEWEMVGLGEVFNKMNDNINPLEYSGNVYYVGLENIESETGTILGDLNTDFKKIKSTKTKFIKNDILYGKLRPNLNKVWLSDCEGICSTDIMVLRENNKHKIFPKFYEIIFRSKDFNLKVLKGLKGSQLPRISYDYFATLKSLYPLRKNKKKL